MSTPASTSYQATYRRSEMALPALLLVVVFLIGGTYFAVRGGDGDRALTVMLYVVAISVAAMIFILIGAFRVHRWALLPDGLEIRQRPKVPLTGIPRRIRLAFPDIAGLSRVEHGFDNLLQLEDRKGRRFRLPQAMKARPDGWPMPDPGADLESFAEAIRTAAAQAGHVLPPTSEALGFWNRPAGIGTLAAMFLFSLIIATATGWALLGGGMPVQPRGGQAMAILLLLPFGAGYALLKMLRRRRRVLASMRASG